MGTTAAGLLVAAANGAAAAIVFGKSVTLSGTVPSTAPGERVDILSRAYGEEQFVRAGVVSTTSGGRWSWVARPRIRTTYRAVWSSRPTASVVVHVSPSLALDAREGVLVAQARAARPLAGRYVILQLRRADGRWRWLRKLVLDARSRSTLRPQLPYGQTELRLYMPAAQAGPGYDAAYSAVLTFINRP